MEEVYQRKWKTYLLDYAYLVQFLSCKLYSKNITDVQINKILFCTYRTCKYKYNFLIFNEDFRFYGGGVEYRKLVTYLKDYKIPIGFYKNAVKHFKKNMDVLDVISELTYNIHELTDSELPILMHRVRKQLWWNAPYEGEIKHKWDIEIPELNNFDDMFERIKMGFKDITPYKF